ncbi:MAG: CheR family methyltransferase [Halanaerobiales bacterium]
MKELSPKEFSRFRRLIYDKYGIYLAPHKMQMIEGRMRKVLTAVGLDNYNDLYKSLLNNDKESWRYFDHEVTTHKTDFFRENSHFQFLIENIDTIVKGNQRISEKKEIRVWSAGCSTGEEPYTIAMVLKEYLSEDIGIKILATDVSSQVIATAQTGIYKPKDEQLDQYFLSKYFTKKDNMLHIDRRIKELITFRTFNLMHPFPFTTQFDIIFCRNVMIYFDNTVQEELIKKIYNTLVPGGLFFIGHSESLSQKEHRFKYIQPTIYRK